MSFMFWRVPRVQNWLRDLISFEWKTAKRRFLGVKQPAGSSPKWLYGFILLRLKEWEACRILFHAKYQGPFFPSTYLSLSLSLPLSLSFSLSLSISLSLSLPLSLHNMYIYIYYTYIIWIHLSFSYLFVHFFICIHTNKKYWKLMWIIMELRAKAVEHNLPPTSRFQ